MSSIRNSTAYSIILLPLYILVLLGAVLTPSTDACENYPIIWMPKSLTEIPVSNPLDGRVDTILVMAGYTDGILDGQSGSVWGFPGRKDSILQADVEVIHADAYRSTCVVTIRGDYPLNLYGSVCFGE